MTARELVLTWSPGPSCFDDRLTVVYSIERDDPVDRGDQLELPRRFEAFDEFGNVLERFERGLLRRWDNCPG